MLPVSTLPGLGNGGVHVPSWKDCLLGLYYHGSLPWRSVLNRRDAARGRAPVMALFYHRVADQGRNSWTCSHTVFAQHIQWLKSHCHLVSLAEAQQRIRSGENREPCVTITFDDGYADNCRFAMPLLLREHIPCTYFVSTRYVFEQLPFPHDVASGYRFAPNTIEQLRDLAAAGIEIGLHTRTHADLGAMTDQDRLRDEVVVAGEELQAALGRPVRYFAFPYGLHANLNATAFQMAYEAGYEAVCSAYGGFNFPGDDAFHLQRIHADGGLLPLKNWLTVDPRKRATPRFEYENPSVIQPRKVCRS